MAAPSAGLLSAATFVPPATMTVEAICEAEGVEAARCERLGIDAVHVFKGDSPTEMAVQVSRAALDKAGIGPEALDAIIDFSVMPQRYVEPAWSMSNELQAELGARGAFTLGFSGGGCSNLHVALRFATSLIEADPDVETVLLVASDAAIPGNRIIGAPDPLTILGDGASAMILRGGHTSGTIEGTRLSCDARMHDVSFIPGGGMAHPERLDLYRLTVDRTRYEAEDRLAAPLRLAHALCRKAGIEISGIDHVLTPNLSRDDAAAFSSYCGLGQSGGGCEVMATHGHLHASDFVLNYLRLQESGLEPGARLLMVSHGMGFTAGATLVRY